MTTTPEEQIPGSGSELEAAQHKRLWQLVLIQALGEAEDQSNKMLAVAKGGRKRVVLRAQAWLSTDSKDLRLVCEYAGLEIERLFKYMRRRYGNRE